MGLADDGGLLIPQSIPDVSDKLDHWRKLAYPELAYQVIRLFATDVPDFDLQALIGRTYRRAFHPEPAPTVAVGDIHVVELFHGPTLAFKDIALQLLGNLFEYILGGEKGGLNILGATSGDTGSAAIYGVRGREGISIFVMHPHQGVSPIQERQMTTVLDDNVHNIAVRGSFDDCQGIMKALAADLEFKRTYRIGAVNSVNWARVVAQIVYYVKAALEVQKATAAEAVRICVPTGNFGNILAGWYAMRMGAPISRLILATNLNNILARFFNSGEYSIGKLWKTLSPSMDIQVASNFERYLYYRTGQDPAALRAMMEQFCRTGRLQVDVPAGEPVDAQIASDSADEQQTLETIRRYWQEHGYLLDPHTAVGVSVAARLAGEDGQPVLCLATAHPAKFPDAIRQATGRDVAHHPEIDKLTELPTRCTELPNDKEQVRQFIIETVG
jgi:threonine synthase